MGEYLGLLFGLLFFLMYFLSAIYPQGKEALDFKKAWNWHYTLKCCAYFQGKHSNALTIILCSLLSLSLSLSQIPLVLLLFPCTSSRGLHHRPLGVTELSRCAHLIPILLISNCIDVPSVHHCLVGYCSHVRWPCEYLCFVVSTFVLRVLCTRYYGSRPVYCYYGSRPVYLLEV